MSIDEKDRISAGLKEKQCVCLWSCDVKDDENLFTFSPHFKLTFKMFKKIEQSCVVSTTCIVIGMCSTGHFQSFSLHLAQKRLTGTEANHQGRTPEENLRLCVVLVMHERVRNSKAGQDESTHIHTRFCKERIRAGLWYSKCSRLQLWPKLKNAFVFNQQKKKEQHKTIHA